MSFLNRLYKEKKIQIVEPNENVKKAYLERSLESITSARTLYKINNLKDAVALTYYSMYYSLLALLFRTGIKCENHTGTILLLKEVFNINDTRIEKAKKERVDKQYYVDFTVTKEEVQEMIRTAEEFNAEILDFAEKLNNEKIENYRKKAKIVLK